MEPSFEGDTELPQWKKVVGMGASGVQELREEVVQGCNARGGGQEHDGAGVSSHSPGRGWGAGGGDEGQWHISGLLLKIT